MKLNNGKGFEIVNKGAEAEVWIYDQIGSDWFGEGVTARGFADQLRENAKGVKLLNVYINSPGGSVWEGTAIHSTLKEHGAKVAVRIDGVAASIASIIAMAGNTISIAPAAMMMIHNPMAGVMGGAKDMRETADLLDKVRGQLIDTYARRTKGNPKAIGEQMDAETWFTGQEAVDAGYADSLTQQDLKVAAWADLGKRFRKAPTASQDAMADKVKTQLEKWIAENRAYLASVGKDWK